MITINVTGDLIVMPSVDALPFAEEHIEFEDATKPNAAYTLDLTQEQAEALCTLLGRVGGISPLRNITEAIYMDLRNAGFNTRTFKGQVKETIHTTGGF